MCSAAARHSCCVPQKAADSAPTCPTNNVGLVFCLLTNSPAHVPPGNYSESFHLTRTIWLVGWLGVWCVVCAMGRARGMKHGDTPLCLAAFKGFTPMVQLLLSKGAALNFRNGVRGAVCVCVLSQRPPMHSATQYLVSQRSWCGQMGDTPLTLACFRGHEDTARVLLEAGAAVNARNQQFNSALIFASDYGHLGCLRVLLAHGADVDAANAVRCGFIVPAATTMLILGRCPLQLGVTALQYACMQGHVACAEALLDAHANVNKASPVRADQMECVSHCAVGFWFSLVKHP